MTICIYIQEEKKVIDYSDMKVKVFFLILSIFFFIPLSTLAQGYIPDPDIQNEEFKEIDRQRAEEEAEQEELEDAESDDSGSQSPKKTGRLRSIYNEYKEKSQKVNDNQKITGSQLVADFITDKLPLTLHLGAEPGEHGSALFGVFQYDWNEKRASKLRLEFNTEKDSRDPSNWFDTEDAEKLYDNYEWISITKKKSIEAIFYPYIRYFGDDSDEAYTPFIYFGLGLFYTYSWYDITTSYWLEKGNQRLMMKADLDGHYHNFGPIAIGSIKVPFLSYFGLHVETQVSPINRIITSADTYISYYYVNEDPIYRSIDSDSQNWCSPTIKIDAALDFMTYFRLRAKFGYTRIYVGSLSDINYGTYSSDENRNETFVLRYGAEIVFPSSNRTRKKDSHLWAGLYYEHSWEKTTTNSNSTTNHTGKWIFCFGT